MSRKLEDMLVKEAFWSAVLKRSNEWKNNNEDKQTYVGEDGKWTRISFTFSITTSIIPFILYFAEELRLCVRVMCESRIP